MSSENTVPRAAVSFCYKLLLSTNVFTCCSWGRDGIYCCCRFSTGACYKMRVQFSCELELWPFQFWSIESWWPLAAVYTGVCGSGMVKFGNSLLTGVVERRKSSPFQNVLYFAVSDLIRGSCWWLQGIKIQRSKRSLSCAFQSFRKTLGKVLHLVNGYIEGSGELVSKYLMRHLYSSGSSLGLQRHLSLKDCSCALNKI